MKVKLISLATALGTSLTALPIAADQLTAADDQAEERIEVLGDRQAYYTEITEDSKKLIELPGALGDPIAAVSALPGVVMPAGGGEPAVRGSSPSDNNYYIDGMPAGYIFHAFNTSIFDPNTVQDFRLYTAGFGAQYSGATGAVFDIRLRDPKSQPIETTITASLLRAGVFVEGQATENSAFYLSARKGLIQYFIDDDEEEDGVRVQSPPEDDDYLFKYVWNINPHNTLTVNLAGASDFAEAEFSERSDMAQTNPDFAGEARLDEQFDSQGITWLHTQPDGSEFMVQATRFEDQDKLSWGQDYFENTSFVNDMLKVQYKTALLDNHTVTLGVEHNNTDFTYQTRSILFVCTEFDVDCYDNRRDLVEVNKQLESTESTAYIIDFWQVNQDLSIETGLQWNTNDYTDERFLNPRIALAWYFVDNVALISSAGRYNRFPDIDTVLPEYGNPDLKSPTSNHYTLGFKGTMGDNWNWNVEGYYKTLKNLPLGIGPEEADADQLYANDIEGTAQGIDVFVNRALADNWYGWVSLSYSDSERTNLRTNESMEYRFDTPVVFNMVGNYQLNEDWTVGFRFIAKSGEATSEITGIRPNPNFPERYVASYDEPFADRMPTYMRLDLRAQRDFKVAGYQAKFFVDIINALDRQNIVERDLDYERVNATGQLYIEEESDMGIFPSVGVSIRF